jgi:NAD+-dependent protein deacetylase SIR2
LHTCFTQNIDTLERRAGISSSKIIEAHGSFATQRCIDCKRPFDEEKMKAKVTDGVVPRCEHCEGLVKPDIVFFGEDVRGLILYYRFYLQSLNQLPPSFMTSIPSLQQADLLIVIGTSLTVMPFAILVDVVPKECPRVLINLDRVGNFNRKDDVVCLGNCDDIVKEICKEIGWGEELMKEWETTAGSVETETEKTGGKPKDDLKDEIDKITSNMEKQLDLETKDGEKPVGGDTNTEPSETALKLPKSKDSADEVTSDKTHSSDGKL